MLTKICLPKVFPANTKTGELIYTPSYYYIGHFSKFVRANAKRVRSTASRSHLLTTSFINEDRTIVTVIMNQSDLSINYRLYIGRNAIEETIPPHSMQTLVY